MVLIGPFLVRIDLKGPVETTSFMDDPKPPMLNINQTNLIGYSKEITTGMGVCKSPDS